MKTNELIKKLQEVDPEGETECCIGNCDIYCVEKLPAYYDGRLQVLIRDHSKDPYYNIIGAKYTERGYKVFVNALSISDAICNAVEFGQDSFPIEYDLANPEKYKESDKKTFELAKDLEKELEFLCFLEWAIKEAASICGDELPKHGARDFFDKNIDYLAPIPIEYKDVKTTDAFGNLWGTSHNDRRKMQYDKEISIEFDGLDFIFKKNV